MQSSSTSTEALVLCMLALLMEAASVISSTTVLSALTSQNVWLGKDLLGLSLYIYGACSTFDLHLGPPSSC